MISNSYGALKGAGLLRTLTLRIETVAMVGGEVSLSYWYAVLDIADGWTDVKGGRSGGVG